MISTKGRYALRLMIDMALYSNGEYIKLKDVSNREGISIKYLEQVVALLNKAGLVISLRGNSGGYKLAKDPKDYTAGEILKAAEGTLAPVQCLQCPTNDCARKSTCSTIEFWEKFNTVINNYVDNITLESLADNTREKRINDFNI